MTKTEDPLWTCAECGHDAEELCDYCVKPACEIHHHMRMDASGLPWIKCEACTAAGGRSADRLGGRVKLGSDPAGTVLAAWKTFSIPA